jgi:serine protease Do
MTTRRHLVVVAAGVLALAACGGGGDDDDSAATTTPTTEASEESETPDTTEAATTTAAPATTAPAPTTVPGISSFNEVQPAVIQIVSTGSLRDPEVGQTTTAGSGSGFIISPDGLAVTNNHVVTGAATLEVFIGGDKVKSYNATVLGVSECNDLALIQIKNVQDLPALDWQDGDPTVGQDVYAAGFPLGDPEFTLTRGIVAKAEADGDTPWASIDHTLEHDANIQPGNSGGPLVGADGKVVAINYASNSATNTSQFFAIDSALAQDVVEQLKNGDFESLGINGSAVVDEEAGVAGVWVSGVSPGSPVDKAGVLPGDIVTSLNGLPIGTDGTMKDYCDVLRTSGTEKPIQIEVLRYDTQEVLRGELNTETPITPVFSFAEEVGDVNTSTATGYSGYQTLVDDTGSITVDVPNEWTDISTTPFDMDDGSQAPLIQASPSLDSFNNSWDVPGLFYGALAPQPDVAATIGLFAPAADQCATDNGVSDYDDSVFTGQYQYWSDCGANGAEYVVLVANPADSSYTAVIAVQILSDADWEALDQAFNTFNVVAA